MRMKISRWDSGAVALAAFAAGILFFDVYPSTSSEARIMMSTNVVRASSSFQSLISSVCWLTGICFALHALYNFFFAMCIPCDEEVRQRRMRRGTRSLFIGVACFSFPFVQSALAPWYYDNGYYDPSVRTSISGASLFFWYFAAGFFFAADSTLRASQKLAGTPEAAALKSKSAKYFLFGFVAIAIPAVLSLWS
jgi:hypothetical protein